MRILSTFNSGNLKITIFNHDMKYSLQVEDGECTQIFKFANEQAPFLQNKEEAAVIFEKHRSDIVSALRKMRKIKREMVISNRENPSESFMEII